MASFHGDRSTWRLSTTLFYRFYSGSGRACFVRRSLDELKTRLTSVNTVRLLFENQLRLSFALNENRDIYFFRNVAGGGTIAMGYDRNRTLKLYISNGARYKRGASVAMSLIEFDTFIEKSNTIIKKMKVSIFHITYLIWCDIDYNN